MKKELLVIGCIYITSVYSASYTKANIRVDPKIFIIQQKTIKFPIECDTYVLDIGYKATLQKSLWREFCSC